MAEWMDHNRRNLEAHKVLESLYQGFCHVLISSFGGDKKWEKNQEGKTADVYNQGTTTQPDLKSVLKEIVP